MKMATPGPWHKLPVVGQGEKAGWWIAAGGYASIAKTIDNIGKTDETTEANADLIASAPELLSTLENIVLLMAGWDRKKMGIEIQYRAARETIAKAKNGVPNISNKPNAAP